MSGALSDMYFCDNCGEKTHEQHSYFISKLQADVASANAGESAVLCDTCGWKHSQIRKT